MRIFCILCAVCFVGPVVSCSSYQKSKTDLGMRFQGTFSCKPYSEEKPGLKETLAEADVSRVRCSKDEWRIFENHVLFTRTLFQSKQCNTPLGRIQFTSSFHWVGRQLILSLAQCNLIRVSPSWLGESLGKCMLNTLRLSTPYELASVYPCTNYVPSECKSPPNRITLDSLEASSDESHSSFRQIVAHTDDAERGSETCDRYEKD